jgi:hypothetical protein
MGKTLGMMSGRLLVSLEPLLPQSIPDGVSGYSFGYAMMGIWSNVIDLHRSDDQCASHMPIEMAHVKDMNTFRVGFWLWFHLMQSYLFHHP